MLPYMSVDEAGNGARALHGMVLKAGRLEVRPAEHAALVDGSLLQLTVKELALLTELAAHPDRILTREELYEAVWGDALRTGDRSVDVYVSRLRSKLQRAMPEHPFIHTHFGVGYRFDPA
jgi:two-component system alkaline phosphatase synthesis response regulator PhoP